MDKFQKQKSLITIIEIPDPDDSNQSHHYHLPASTKDQEAVYRQPACTQSYL